MSIDQHIYLLSFLFDVVLPPLFVGRRGGAFASFLLPVKDDFLLFLSCIVVVVVSGEVGVGFRFVFASSADSVFDERRERRRTIAQIYDRPLGKFREDGLLYAGDVVEFDERSFQGSDLHFRVVGDLRRFFGRRAAAARVGRRRRIGGRIIARGRKLLFPLLDQLKQRLDDKWRRICEKGEEMR